MASPIAFSDRQAILEDAPIPWRVTMAEMSSWSVVLDEPFRENQLIVIEPNPVTPDLLWLSFTFATLQATRAAAFGWLSIPRGAIALACRR